MEELQSYVREPDKYLVGTVGDRGSGKWQWHSCFDMLLLLYLRNKAKEKWKTSSNQGKVTTTDKISSVRWVSELTLLIFSLYPFKTLSSGIKASMSDLKI